MAKFWVRALLLICSALPAFAQNHGGCGSIPGCRRMLEARSGPFVASIMVVVEAAGGLRHILDVNYFENEGSGLRFCAGAPARDLDLVILLPSGDGLSVLRRPMHLSCPRDFGANPGLQNSARWSFHMEDHPELWDLLFPVREDGERRFELWVAAVNSRGQWDSQFGRNYHLTFQENRP